MDWLLRDTRVALRGCNSHPPSRLLLSSSSPLAWPWPARCTRLSSTLLQPLPVRDQDRIVVLNARDRNGVDVSLAGQDFADLCRDTRLVQNMAGIYHAGPFVQPLDLDGRPIELNGAIVTGNFFEMLGVRPVLGRLLRPADDSIRGVEAVVLSYSAWRGQFGGDPSVLGKHLRSPYELPPYTDDFRIIRSRPTRARFPGRRGNVEGRGVPEPRGISTWSVGSPQAHRRPPQVKNFSR